MFTPTSADRDWFEREVISALPDLYGSALRFAKNVADAEDLVAETVAKGWTNLGALNDRARVRGWLFTILTNTYISDCRGLAAHPAVESLDQQPDDQEFSLFERLHQPFLLWWGDTERDFLRKLLRHELERAVDSLPEAFRVVVVMADVQGFSYKEIADVLAVPIGTVRSRLARGRSILQKALWEHAVDAGLLRTRGPTKARTRSS